MMMILRPQGLLPERRREAEMTHADEHRGRVRLHGTRMSETNGNGNVVLDAQHVTKQFGGLTAVSDVNFSVPEKSIVSIIGPNGAGKTTFFNMLTGFYKPTIGRITFADATSPASVRT